MLHTAEMSRKTTQNSSESFEERRQAREARIVDAVVELAEEGGFEAVRSRTICTRAEVTMGTLYRHFSSIEEILLYAFSRDFGVFEKDFPESGIPGETASVRLGVLFRGLTESLVQRPLFARAVVRAIASGQNKALERVEDLDSMLQAYIEAAWLGLGPAGRDGASTAESRLVASTLERVWFSLMIGWAASMKDVDDVVSELAQTTALFR